MFHFLLSRRELVLEPVVVANELLRFIDVLGEVPGIRLIDPARCLLIEQTFSQIEEELFGHGFWCTLGEGQGLTTITHMAAGRLVEEPYSSRTCRCR
jgi:hypothetical protein